MAGFLALALVSMEAAINTTVTSVTTTSRESYTADNEEVRILKDSLEPASDFYRVEKKTRKTKNDGAWMNFPSVSLFSSTANADLSKVFKKLDASPPRTPTASREAHRLWTASFP